MLSLQKEDSELMTNLWIQMQEEENELEATPFLDIPGYIINFEFVER